MRNSLLCLAAAAALTSGIAHAEPATYAIDPHHTYATFEIGHFGASVNRGRFDKKQGLVHLDKAAKAGKVEITFDIESINTGSVAFNRHLLAADLFNAEEYPTMNFVSDKFIFDGDKISEVTGQLTLMGKTAPLTLKAKQFNCYDNSMLKREVCGGDFAGTLDRTQWGMNYGVDRGFSKTVNLVVTVEAIKQ